MTDCQCEEPGWCERHKVRKGAHWVYLCQTSEKYYAAWEEGRGPGQMVPTPGPAVPGKLLGPGRMLAKLLGCHSGFKHAAVMDRWGCEKCLAEINTIIGWITQPCPGRAAMCEDSARRLVKLAVKRVRKQ